VRNTPELQSLLGDQIVASLLAAKEDQYEKALKEAFSALMATPKEALSESLTSLEARVRQTTDRNEEEELFLRLCSQYPGDVGCLVIFFVNLVKLKPGEALFLGPNLIHAYLSGDCVECMACSDNVIRAGLTPKYIDVATLCSLLKYKCAPGASMKFTPVKESQHTLLYDPPVRDFAVARTEVKGVAEMAPRDAASIALVESGRGMAVIDGEERPIQMGEVLFLNANQKMTLTSENEVLRVFQAFC